MNRIGLFAMLGALATTPAYAQQRVDPAIPKGASDQQVQPSAELAKPKAAPRPPRLVQNEKRHMHDADARQCLEQANNKAIHRCSLKYRSHVASAATVKKAKASAKGAPEPAPAITLETPKAPETGKPAAPKPADTAKAADLVKPVDVTKAGAVPKPAESAKAAPAAPAAAAPSAAAPPPPPAKAPEAAKK